MAGHSSKAVLAKLRNYESRNVTYVDPDGHWPIVWDRARGVHVWDLEGKKYLDLTAAFGVAAAGHANPRVVNAGQKQMAHLLHAMGDVHPHALKADLARELSRLTFERWSTGRFRGKTVFGNSGFEAVEVALKTSLLATGKPGIIAFKGAYHGLGHGALNATSRKYFRSSFEAQLGQFGSFVEFPERPSQLRSVEDSILRLIRKKPIGAILVEPVQGRGGIRVPPPKFLSRLKHLTRKHGLLLVVDEIYTGFGRTGHWFACERDSVVPDLVCLGKAMTGGFPLSACVGRQELMDQAWPETVGEAIHTSTFLGHPVGCAMALAQIKEIKTRKLVQQSARLGIELLRALDHLSGQIPLAASARGLGLMVGLEIRTSRGKPATQVAMDIVKQMLQRGFIMLPEGEDGNVISWTPPLTITSSQLTRSVNAMRKFDWGQS